MLRQNASSARPLRPNLMDSVVMIFSFADLVMAFPGPVLVDAIPAIANALVAAYTNSFFLLGSRASTS